MSRHDKLLLRFLSRPKDFTYNELRTMLSGLGYKEEHSGAASGSRVAFFNMHTKHIIRLHKPHPGNILNQYQIDLITDELNSKEIIQ